MRTHLKREIDKVLKLLFILSADVENVIKMSANTFLKADLENYTQLIKLDDKIDEKEIEIEEDCLKIFALYQPVAQDLRNVVSILKINNTLERIADLAINIAKSAKRVEEFPKSSPVADDFDEMIKAVISSFQRTVDIIVEPEVAKCISIIKDDSIIDRYNKRIIHTLSDELRNNQEYTNYFMECIYTTRTIERIGDLLTNVAEDVIYTINGDIIRHREI